MPLIYLSFAWISGIFLGARFNWPLALILIIALIPFALFFIMTHQRKWFLLLGLCLFIFFGGGLYFQSRLPSQDDNLLQFYNDKGQIEIKGIVSHDPEAADKTIRLLLSATHIAATGHEVSGNVLLIVARHSTGNSTYRYGDVLMVKGKLEIPPQLDDFDYRGYLASQGVYSIMFYPEIEMIETSRGFKPIAWVYRLRERLAYTLAGVLPEPQASLAQGIVLGLRGNIPSPVKDEFIHTGTAHLLAISGVNLSIMTGILVSVGIWLFGRRHYIYVWLALGTLWFYALITGFNPPVVRAAVMASLFLIAELLGRQRSVGTALVFAAAVMVSFSPQALWDDSFQMSFMAMAGLIMVFPPLQALGRKTVSKALANRQAAASMANAVVDSFSVSIAAVIAVWPLIAYYFGTISWVGPLATFLTTFSMPGIIIFSSLAGISGLFFLPLAQGIALVAWLFLSYLLLVVKIFDLVPFSTVSSFDGKWIWIYYAGLALVLWLNTNRPKLFVPLPKVAAFFTHLPKKWVIPGLLVVTILVWLTAATIPDEKLRVDFLNVGQGDATLIQQGSQQVLVDGGPSAQAITSGLSKEMPFWDRTIDLLILTHPHADHITGLLEVLKRYRVKQVLYVDFAYDSPLFDEWHDLIAQKNIKYTGAEAGQQIAMGKALIEILNPPKPLLTGTDSNIDNNGIVARLSIGRVSFLLTADTMWETEMELVTHRANLSSTVLKTAHHGSATSTTAEFLAVVDPDIAVISVGVNNDFGHPNKEVVARLREKVGQENIYRTDEHGTIEFSTDGKRLWVNVEK